MADTKVSSGFMIGTWHFDTRKIVGVVAALSTYVLANSGMLPAGTPAWVPQVIALCAILGAWLTHSPMPKDAVTVLTDAVKVLEADKPDGPPPGAVVLLLAVAIGLGSSGCGASLSDSARTDLMWASLAANAANRTLNDAATNCTDADCNQKLSVARDAVNAADSSIRAGEAALSANSTTLIMAVVPCVAAAVAQILTALSDAHIVVPEIVTQAVRMLQAVVGPCGSGDVPARLRTR